MPRSMWRGAVSFGMVSIPVRMYLATESHGVSFRQLCPEHVSPIKLKRWCSAADHEVPFGSVLRGYEVAKDEYVIVEDSDLDNLPLPTSKAIEIQEFVPTTEIPPALYYKAAYYLEPEEAGRKPYLLLRQALEKTERVAVAKIALRDREHLCALQPGQDMILLNTLNWPDEIRSTEDLKGLMWDGIKVDDRELQMATMLVENLSSSFDPSRYHDDYREALQKVVQAKIEGGAAVEAPEVAEPSKVMDLMEALKASVEAAKARRETEAEAPEAKPARRKAS